MKIVIPGIPIAKARHKLCRRGQHISMYDPQEAEKKSLKLFVKSQLPPNYSLSQLYAFSVHFNFYFPFSSNHFPWITSHYIKKPDVDNATKFYCDVLNEICYIDDKQIVEIYAKKLYSDQPRTEIEIMPLEIHEIDENVMKVMRIFDPVTLKSMLNDTHTLNIVHQKLEKGQTQPDFADLLTAAASLLVNFSIKYKDLLSKLVKVGEIPCDLTPYEYAVRQHSTEIY